jgi:hypothetical protein
MVQQRGSIMIELFQLGPLNYDRSICITPPVTPECVLRKIQNDVVRWDNRLSITIVLPKPLLVPETRYSRFQV